LIFIFENEIIDVKDKIFKIDKFERRVLLIVLVLIALYVTYSHFSTQANKNDVLYMGGYNAGYQHPSAENYSWYTALVSHHNQLFGSDNVTIAEGYLKGMDDLNKTKIMG
jgi:hypothetical protein